MKRIIVRHLPLALCIFGAMYYFIFVPAMMPQLVLQTPTLQAMQAPLLLAHYCTALAFFWAIAKLWRIEHRPTEAMQRRLGHCQHALVIIALFHFFAVVKLRQEAIMQPLVFVVCFIVIMASFALVLSLWQIRLSLRRST